MRSKGCSGVVVSTIESWRSGRESRVGDGGETVEEQAGQRSEVVWKDEVKSAQGQLQSPALVMRNHLPVATPFYDDFPRG